MTQQNDASTETEPQEVPQPGEAAVAPEAAEPRESAAPTEPVESTASSDAAAGDEADESSAADEDDQTGDDQTAAAASERGEGGPSSRKEHLEREGEVAADFLETLLDIADLDGDLDVDIEGDRAAVAIVDSDEGRVPRRLVGQGGAVLEALQELTRLAVQAETGERSRLMLDVAGHRAQRRADLVESARVVIDEVKETGERRSLEPMSAFERKVVHDAVLAAGLTSESEGAEPRRYVVVLPA